ncbi:PLP-dependent transferase [Daedaleopsis nitida]|nr:PLP-dependent transferase [Daedaleopsis nitida]
MSTPLEIAIEKAFVKRRQLNVGCPDFRTPMPTNAADLFSNDYLSVTTEPRVRDAYLQNLQKLPLVIGSAGSRLLTGNTSTHTQFEERAREYWGGLPGCSATAACLFNSGYDGNLAFFGTVPQKGDAVVFDELVHASIRDGLHASPHLKTAGALYPFKHNSVESFRERVQHALKRHPNIAAGKGTLFIAVETLYSMDGDYAPLRQIFDASDELIPKGCAHILVDEAHTSGLYGPDGRGLLFDLGLQGRVQSVIHTFSKVWGMSGSILMTSPLIRHYIVLYARPMMYSTSLPHSHVCALDTTFDFVTGPDGVELRQRLRKLCAYFTQILQHSLRNVPASLLHLREQSVPEDYPSHVFSPIFPLISHSPKMLEDFLRPYGYGVTAIPYPTVPRGEERIRVVLHAHNTEEELDMFVTRVMQWVALMMAAEKKRKEINVERPQVQGQVQLRAML